MIEAKCYEDGIHTITNEQYHAANGYSRSQLMAFDKSPYHFWYEYLSGKASIQEPTEAMLLGSAIHTLILQPELFEKEYKVMPKMDRRTTAGKEAYALFMQDAQDKIILTFEQHQKITDITCAVMEHDIVHTLLKNSVYEQSIFWTDEETGLQFKVRPDIWSSNMIVDLKTTDDANPYRFSASAYKNGYYLQAGMIWEACRVLNKPFEMFTILAVEKKEPYVPAVFIIKDSAIDFGIEQFNKYKRQLKECLNNNKWEPYPVHELEVPKFAQINPED